MNHLLNDARREVLEKTREQIEHETAFKWAARAVAAYELFRQTRLNRWLCDSEHFRDEACEHGAMADETGEALRAVRAWMHRYIP
jgi:hypothetical protein